MWGLRPYLGREGMKKRQADGHRDRKLGSRDLDSQIEKPQHSRNIAWIIRAVFSLKTPRGENYGEHFLHILSIPTLGTPKEGFGISLMVLPGEGFAIPMALTSLLLTVPISTTYTHSGSHTLRASSVPHQ